MLALIGILASALVTGMAEGGGTVSGESDFDRLMGMWIALPLPLLPLVASTPLSTILGGAAGAAFVIPTGPVLVNTTSSTAGIGVFFIPVCRNRCSWRRHLRSQCAAVRDTQVIRHPRAVRRSIADVSGVINSRNVRQQGTARHAVRHLAVVW